MTDPLSKLFGSLARVKLLRLFLFNTRQSFTPQDAARRARITLQEARREFNVFKSIDLISRVTRGRGVRYGVVSSFPYIEVLQNLLLNAPVRGKDIADSLRGVGSIKLIALSGMFVGEWDTLLDLLIVGDRVQEKKLRDRIKRFEAELGKEIRFAVLSTEDFLYRLNMNEKLIRDIFDYTHRIVIDKINTGLK